MPVALPSQRPLAVLREAPLNVEDPRYGAVGDDIADDTAVLQTALNDGIAARGTVYFPQPISRYKVTSQLVIQPSGAGAAYVNLIGHGGPLHNIRWAGPPNTAVFWTRDWKFSTVDNLSIRVTGTPAGVIGWDIDGTDPGGSTGRLDFRNSHVTSDAALTDMVGFRTGARAAGNPDVSLIDWYDCNVSNAAQSSTSVGWQNLGSNSVHHNWYGCGAAYLRAAFSNAGTVAHPNPGNAGLGFSGCGGSFNDVAYEFAQGGAYNVSGGRWEEGKRFLDLKGGGFSTVSVEAPFLGVQISNHNPADGILVNADRAAHLTFDDIRVSSGLFGAAMFTLATGDGPPAGHGSLRVVNSALRATDPFYTVTRGRWNLDFTGTTLLDSSFRSVAFAALPNVGVSGNHTMAPHQKLVRVTSTAAARTITLPPAAGVPPFEPYIVKDESGGANVNSIVVERAGSDTIEGGTSKAITVPYGFLRLYSTGSGWMVA